MTEHPAAPDSPDARPVLRIVSGDPSAEELAALAAVLSAVATSSDQDDPTTTELGSWSDLSLRLRRPLPAGPGAWRNSFRG